MDDDAAQSADVWIKTSRSSVRKQYTVLANTVFTYSDEFNIRKRRSDTMGLLRVGQWSRESVVD